MPYLRVKVPAFSQDKGHHDRARHRDRKAHNDSGAPLPAQGPQQGGQRGSGKGALYECARHGDAPHGRQFAEVKAKAYAEHEKDDSDFGELLGHGLVCREAGGKRADRYAGQKVADYGRQLQPLGDETENKRRGQAAGKSQQYM